jgi:hypothetical protein
MDNINIRLRAIAALADPTSDIGLSINLLIRDVERDQKRRAGQRKRTQKSRAKSDQNRYRNGYGNATVTVTDTPHPNTTNRYGNGYGNDVIEERKKEHISNIDNLTVTYSGKPKTKPALCLPEDWKLPQSWINGAAKFGMNQAEADIEGMKFKNHHIAKGEKRKNWFFAWQNWCINFMERQKKSFQPRPLTPFQANQAKREEVLAKLREFAYGTTEDKPKNGSPLGSPDNPTFPFGGLTHP